MHTTKNFPYKSISKKQPSYIRHKLDMLYLSLHDCDGMCDHCDEKLREKCFRVKGFD